MGKDPDLRYVLAGRLRELRGQRPQALIAERMGLSRVRYCEWENGDIPSSVVALARLATAERIDMNALLGGPNGRR